MASARLARRPAEQRHRSLARAVGTPPSVLRGRVPRERHEHYDAEGNLTGFTVVVRESAWLDSDVTDLLMLAQVEAEACDGCGWHPEAIDDNGIENFGPVDHVCEVCAGSDQYRRYLQASDEKWLELNKDAEPISQRPADGRHTRMTILTAEEFKKRRGGDDGRQD